MKAIALWTLMLWSGLILEHSNPLPFPSASVVMPLAIGCLFWFRGAWGIVLAGLALLLRWLLNPTLAPFEIATVLLLSTLLMTRHNNRNAWSPVPEHRVQHDWWLCPLIALLTSLTAHVCVVTEFSLNAVAAGITDRLIIGVPCLTFIVFIIRAADEFGLRRWSHKSQM